MRRARALLVLLCLLAYASVALAASQTATESYHALVQQIDARQVVSAHVNEETHHVSVTLKNGTDEFVIYPAADHKVLVDALIHHGVTPVFVKKTAQAKPVHHVLRYVAGGVVIVLLLIGGGVWAYTRGPRQPPAPHAGAPPAAGPPDAPTA